MKKEISKAVEAFHRIALGTKQGKVPEKKLAAFITVLTELLTARYEKNWYPENPKRGSGYRCIRVNWQCIDPTIVESLKRSNLGSPRGLMNTELTIWVDPGIVSVRIGEDGSIGTEIVDEAVYKLSQKSTEEKSESDEGFSSRSSSPESTISESSGTASPPQSRSPIPAKSASSPSPPVMEYNPYSPPNHVSYSHRFQHSSPALQPAQQLKSPVSHFQPSSARSQGRPMMLQGSPMVSSPQDVFGQAHIPASAAQRSSYTRPRALFSTQENSSTSRGSLEGYAKMAFSQYAMNYGANMPQANFYDIPAMA